MFSWFQYRHNQIFWIFLGIYALLGLCNLETLPVAWTDETMNLDPAIQYTKYHQYFSKLWPNPGAENVFASYPPLIQFWHIFWLNFFQPTIFNVRLPFLLMHLSTLALLYQLLSKKSSLFGLLCILIFATDKTVFEMSRSVRIEVLILFLFTLFFYLNERKSHPILLGSIAGLLSIAHLYTLPILFVIFIKRCINFNLKNNLIFLLFALLPVIFSLYFIDFNYQQIYQQLSLQAQKHSPQKTGILLTLKASLFDRFWPYYKEMPLNFMMYIGIFVLNLVFIFKHLKRPFLLFSQNFTIELFAFSFTLFFLITPQYRYLPVFLLLGLLFLRDNGHIAPFKTSRFPIIVTIIIAFNGILIYSIKHSVAIWQRNERLSEPFLEFIASNIPQNKKTLILGESIGEYYAATRKNCDYGLDYHPQHFNFSDYDQVYYLSKSEIKPAKMIAIYQPETSDVPKFITKFVKGGTYSNTIIWKVESIHDFKIITAPYLQY